MYIFLFVESAPEIEPYHNFREVHEGHRTKLICRVKGHPRPFLLWYRAGELLDVENNPRFVEYCEIETLLQNVWLVVQKKSYKPIVMSGPSSSLSLARQRRHKFHVC